MLNLTCLATNSLIRCYLIKISSSPMNIRIKSNVYDENSLIRGSVLLFYRTEVNY